MSPGTKSRPSLHKKRMSTDTTSWQEYGRQELEIVALKDRVAELEETLAETFGHLQNLGSEEILTYLEQDGDPVVKFLFVIRWLRKDFKHRAQAIPDLLEHLELDKVFDTNRNILDAAFQYKTGVLSESVDGLQMYCKVLASKVPLGRRRLASSSGAGPSVNGKSKKVRPKSLSESDSTASSTEMVEILPTKRPSPRSPAKGSKVAPKKPRFLKTGTGPNPKSKLGCSPTTETMHATMPSPVSTFDAGAVDQSSPEYIFGSPTTGTEDRRCVGSSPSANNLVQNNHAVLFYANKEPLGRFLYSYNWKTSKSEQRYKYEYARDYSAMVIIRDRLYDLGGTETRFQPIVGDDSKGSDIVEIFGVGEERHRSRGVALYTPRKELSACAVEDYIYVIGGCCGGEALTSCERLNCFNVEEPNRNWELIPHLIVPRASHSTAVIGQKIFGIGGIQNVPIASVEYLDTNKVQDNGGWTIIASMASPRARHASVGFNDKIYVVGGIDQNYKEISTVEVFEPGANSWTRLPDMPNRHVNAGIFPLGNELVVIGGISSRPLNTVLDAYDPRAGAWRQISWPKGLLRTGKFYNGVNINPNFQLSPNPIL